MEVDINIADGRTVGLVTGSVVLDRFPKLRHDAVGMTMGQWWLELVEAVTKPEQDAVAVYEMAVTTLRELESSHDQSVGRRWLELCRHALQLMIHEGFAPAMDVCSVCHQPLADTDTAYDARQGFLHQHEAGDPAMELEPATVAYLRNQVAPVQERAVFAQAHRVMESLIHHTLDRPLKSEQVLRAIIRGAKLPTSG